MDSFYKKNKVICVISGDKQMCKKGLANATIHSMGMMAGGESGVSASKKLVALTPEERTALRNGDTTIMMDVELIDTSGPTYNKFFYSEAVMQESLAEELLNRKIANGGMPCEANHPVDRNDLARYEHVDMNNVTHYIHKIWQVGKKFFCRLETKAIPNNPIVLDILQGRIPAFSIRGLLYAHKEGDITVVDKYMFVSLDYVSVQSNLGSAGYTDLKIVDFDGNTRAVAYKPVGDEIAKASGESARGFLGDTSKIYELKLAGGESALVMVDEVKAPHTASDVLSAFRYF